MSTRPVILGWSLFRSSASAHGGNARSEQIAGLVEKAGFTYEVIDRDRHRRAMKDRLHGWVEKTLHRQRWSSISAGLLGYYSALLDERLRTHNGPRIILCEDSLHPVPLWRARRFGFKTIALPHNVESLIGAGSDLKKLDAERAALNEADAVFCISDEDAWLWSNLGIDARVLPYFPLGERRKRFTAVAAARPATPPANTPWLLLGTAHHKPTREGMLTALRWLKPALDNGLTVIVAGHGTSSLGCESMPGVTLAGSLSDQDLDTLLLRARGLIVHQDCGTGALTRIPEAITAGLPVLANRIAARSSGSLPGVVRYETAADLLSLLQTPPTSRESISEPAVSNFIAQLHAYARPGRTDIQI